MAEKHIGRVTLTMAKIRARFWIQHLRQLAKTVTHRCNSCKRFQVLIYFAPVPEQLSNDRTNGYRALQVVVLDYTGPIFYKGKNKNLKKVYILLITCMPFKQNYALGTSSESKIGRIHHMFRKICSTPWFIREWNIGRKWVKSKRFQYYLSKLCIK